MEELTDQIRLAFEEFDSQSLEGEEPTVSGGQTAKLANFDDLRAVDDGSDEKRDGACWGISLSAAKPLILEYLSSLLLTQ